MSSKAKKIQKNIIKDQTNTATKNISDSLIMMGHCQCGAPIFSYIDPTDSKDRYDMYCMGDSCGYVSDIRFPRQQDQFFMKHPHSPLEMLTAAYKEKGVDITEEAKTAPQSANVGKHLGPNYRKSKKKDE